MGSLHSHCPFCWDAEPCGCDKGGEANGPQPTLMGFPIVLVDSADLPDDARGNIVFGPSSPNPVTKPIPVIPLADRFFDAPPKFYGTTVAASTRMTRTGGRPPSPSRIADDLILAIEFLADVKTTGHRIPEVNALRERLRALSLDLGVREDDPRWKDIDFADGQ